jgi:hypothetical protein
MYRCERLSVLHYMSVVGARGTMPRFSFCCVCADDDDCTAAGGCWMNERYGCAHAKQRYVFVWSTLVLYCGFAP